MASHLSGHPIYAGSRVTASHSPATALRLSTRTLLEDHTALMDHLDAIGRDIDTDPSGAITSAKDLVETMCKLILDKRGVAYGKDDLPVLYKKVSGSGVVVRPGPRPERAPDAAHHPPSPLPPLLPQAATGDPCSLTTHLAEHAEACGVQTRLELYPVTTHDFQLFWSCLPDAGTALANAMTFVEVVATPIRPHRVELQRLDRTSRVDRHCSGERSRAASRP